MSPSYIRLGLRACLAPAEVHHEGHLDGKVLLILSIVRARNEPVQNAECILSLHGGCVARRGLARQASKPGDVGRGSWTRADRD
jgi:hypothetical protein